MNISVIIPTYNNCVRLECTLIAFTSLVVSASISWELIIVDNNSIDLTKKVISDFSKNLPIKYIFEPAQGTSNAKNSGLHHAIGELVVFTDDDVKPCADWLNIYWKEFLSNPNGFFWGGPVESDFEIVPEDMELISLGPPSVKGLTWGTVKKVLAINEFFIGANWAAPLKIIIEVGGFDAELGLNASGQKVLVGEETDLMDRLRAYGLTPIYLPDCTVRHFVTKSKMTIDHIASRAEANGRFSAKWVLSSSTVYFCGVPRWVYGQMFKFWFKSMLKRLMKKKWYTDYIAYSRLLGCVKQIKNL